MTMDEEKAEVLCAFFASLLNKDQLFLEGPAPELEHGDEEENKAHNPRGNCCEVLLH